MSRPVVALLVAPAAGKPIRPAPVVRLPVGQWEVVLANGVVGTCEVRRDGLAHEVGPLCKGTRPVVGVARRK